jgi:hypothetical protein
MRGVGGGVGDIFAGSSGRYWDVVMCGEEE